MKVIFTCHPKKTLGWVFYEAVSKEQSLNVQSVQTLSWFLFFPKLQQEVVFVFLSTNFVLFLLLQPKPIDVQVITHHMQRYAVWFGGSMLASTVSIKTMFSAPLMTRNRPFFMSIFWHQQIKEKRNLWMKENWSEINKQAPVFQFFFSNFFSQFFIDWTQ